MVGRTHGHTWDTKSGCVQSGRAQRWYQSVYEKLLLHNQLIAYYRSHFLVCRTHGWGSSSPWVSLAATCCYSQQYTLLSLLHAGSDTAKVSNALPLPAPKFCEVSSAFDLYRPLDMQVSTYVDQATPLQPGQRVRSSADAVLVALSTHAVTSCIQVPQQSAGSACGDLPSTMCICYSRLPRKLLAPDAH